jgi:predicted dehydrogenase
VGLNSPIDVVLIGAGNRGTFTFGRAALDDPTVVQFTAVAEPDEARRARFATQHNIPLERCFASWEDLISAGRLASAAVCCTLDGMHVAPTVAALEAGYHVLLEKPMAATPDDCIRIVQAGERTGKLLMICHVLRFAPFFAALHDIVASGRLGDIVTVEHRENVAYWHMAHSYVRGNWRQASQATPMLLAKCCHDLDLLVWMMADNPVVRLASFGSLLHFRSENAPPGAPERCTDGCPASEDCPYFAPRLYLTEDVGWPTETISVDLSREARLHALQTGPDGRCVYRADNDVVDHQVVTMEHATGATSNLIMHGHSDVEERTMRFDGTRATARARFSYFGESSITVHDHRSGETEMLSVPPISGSGHGGGDSALLQAFAGAVRAAATSIPTSARVSLESHLLAFAAERSRECGRIIEMPGYRTEIEMAARNYTPTVG